MDPYQSSETSNDSPIVHSAKQTLTTVLAITYMVLAGIGLIVAVFSVGVSLSDTYESGPMSQVLAQTSSILSLLSKSALMIFAFTLLIRARRIKYFLISGILVSTLDTILAMVFVSQLNLDKFSHQTMMNSWWYIWTGVPYLVSLAMYLGVFFHLRTNASRKEFELS